MQRIDTRTQLINFICENISQRAIVRACHHPNGNVQVMGGFSRIPPSCLPGWIVVITSGFGRTWTIAVTPDEHKHVFRVWMIKEIPWQFYTCPSLHAQQQGYSIYNGDNPDQARMAWMKAKLLEAVKDV